MKTYCTENGMRFAAIESYTEDMAIWDKWGGKGGTSVIDLIVFYEYHYHV